MTTREHATRTQQPPAEDSPGPAPLAAGSANAVLALQRTIGNAAVGRLLQRQETATAPPPTTVTGYAAWTDPEVRAIQREIVRLRL